MNLIPSLVVLVCAVAGSGTHRDPCLDTDGPQYKCWLERQG